VRALLHHRSRAVRPGSPVGRERAVAENQAVRPSGTRPAAWHACSKTIVRWTKAWISTNRIPTMSGSPAAPMRTSHTSVVVRSVARAERKSPTRCRRLGGRPNPPAAPCLRRSGPRVAVPAANAGPGRQANRAFVAASPSRSVGLWPPAAFINAGGPCCSGCSDRKIPVKSNT
jgi:hypothetical protein